jgi:hypothetical protein
MRTKLPPFILRTSLLSAITGGLIGLFISFDDGDALGWSLLRGAVLSLVFGYVTRWCLAGMARAWIESRLESLQPKNKTVENRPAVRAGA